MSDMYSGFNNFETYNFYKLIKDIFYFEAEFIKIAVENNNEDAERIFSKLISELYFKVIEKNIDTAEKKIFNSFISDFMKIDFNQISKRLLKSYNENKESN